MTKRIPAPCFFRMADDLARKQEGEPIDMEKAERELYALLKPKRERRKNVGRAAIAKAEGAE